MTISIQFKSIKVSLSKVEETYIRARYFQKNAKKLGLADTQLSSVLDRNGNPVASTILHDAVHQLYNLSTSNPDEKLVDMICLHIVHNIEFNKDVKSSVMAEPLKGLLTNTDSNNAYYVYANLHKMDI